MSDEPLTDAADQGERAAPNPAARGCVGVLAALGLAIAALAVTRCDSTLALVDNVRLVLDEPEWGAGMETADDVLDYLVAHPDEVALVAATIGEDGVLRWGGAGAVRHNVRTPMPLASAVKLVHLAAWARAAERGRIDPEGPVSARRWTAWRLPGSDGGAHAAALADLGVEDPPSEEASVPWASVAQAMVRHNDLAAPELIREELGDASLDAVLQDGGMNSHEPVGSLLGLLLLGANHEHPAGDGERLEALASAPAKDRADVAHDLADRWRTPAWSEQERTWRTDDPPLGRLRRQAQMAELFPKASASDYARMLASVTRERFISPAVSQRMREHLEWPMAVGENSRRFASFGSKGGALPGVFVDATYVTPRQGDFAGETRVVVLMMRHMPMSAWLRLLKTQGQQYFVLKVAERKLFAEKVAKRLAAGVTAPADRTRR